MSKRKPKGNQIDTIQRGGDLFQATFDLDKQDQFVTSLGVDFYHYSAMPSPIGMKEKGDYRKSDTLDTISSNGMIYTKVGCFTATMVGNSRSQSRAEGGFVDQSTSRLVMPRFYNKQGEQANADRIYMAPGDRVYIADPNADDLVPNYQRMEFVADRDNRPMFPICKMQSIIDSLGNSFREGIDYEITLQGDIRWLSGGQNPGHDTDNGKGRVYAIRYLYKAHWYIIQLPNEVRITNTTDGEVRQPQRMANHVVIQREYVYRSSQNDSSESNNNPRKVDAPIERIKQPDDIRVNMNSFSEDEDE